MSAPVDCVPLTFLVPLQAPVATQLVAFDADHDKVEFVPLAILDGRAAMLIVGAGGKTVTVTDWLADPPAPLHVSVYVELAASGPLVSVPLIFFAPLHAPLAIQLVALVDDHDKIELDPLETDEGPAEI